MEKLVEHIVTLFGDGLVYLVKDPTGETSNQANISIPQQNMMALVVDHRSYRQGRYPVWWVITPASEVFGPQTICGLVGLRQCITFGYRQFRSMSISPSYPGVAALIAISHQEPRCPD